MTARLLIGDVFERLAEIPDGSVDLVGTSPPFLGLRSYLPADHPDKQHEIGSEATPAAFLDVLLDLTVELRRVLAPHGSLCLELGDTFSGSGGSGGDYAENGLREGQALFGGSGKAARSGKPTLSLERDRYASSDKRPGWPLAKSLCGIPTLYAWSLAYGHNLLNPAHEVERWRVRNVLVWARPNPPVGALGDKFRPATSYITVACTGAKRWFDLDAVRTDHAEHTQRYPRDAAHYSNAGYTVDSRGDDGRRDSSGDNPAGAPPLDWANDLYDGPTGDRLWVMPTQPYSGAHYAVFPEALPRRLIQAMCPQRVCTVCGKPSERITADPVYVRTGTDRVPARLTMLDGERPAAGVNQHLRADGANTSVVRQTGTVGWSDCGHDSWRPGLTLDPFTGSGTTLQVATELGRDSIGIDLDPRSADLARERCGMFLEVDNPAPDDLPHTHNPTGAPRFREGYQVVHPDTGRVQGPKVKDYGT